MIYEGTPARPVGGQDQTAPILAGTFPLDTRAKHVVTAEAASTHTKAQIEWTPQLDGSTWLVIRYYAGRHEPGEPAFFTFQLQSSPAKVK
ncbi:hypothetical protein [Paludibaculum fermentans]|uniref:hypothetical protein n=1 Tax=Paludibaculum fermentans TaxID=1473598 RepID=UPI003EBD24F9